MAAEAGPAAKPAAASIAAAFKRRRWLVFLVAGIAFFGFAGLSLNLLNLLVANFQLISEHGVLALRDGAALQLAELALSGYGALAFYLVFKYCERIIVDWLDRFE